MEADSAVGSSAAVPQSEPLDETQVRNNAGGFVFKIDDIAQLRRLVILGSDANNYYVSRSEVDLKSAECVMRLLASGEGARVVAEVTRISQEGRAAKQSPGILVLAMCARLGDAATRAAALAALPAVCRTASTLFEWIQRCKELGAAARVARKPDDTAAAAADPAAVMAWATEAEARASEIRTKKAAAAAAAARHLAKQGRRIRMVRPPAVTALSLGAEEGKPGWGRAMRRAVAMWYLEKSPAAVAYQVTKYSQRYGWSHADLLRLAHPDPEAHAARRRKLAAAAAEAKAAEAAAAVVEQLGLEAGTAAEGKEGKEKEGEEDWVMVRGSTGAASLGEESDDVQMLGGLAEAVAEAEAKVAEAAKAAAAAGGDAASAARAAAEAQRVADMKAIFDFLTHGTLPDQPRPARRGKSKTAADEQPKPTAADATAPGETAVPMESEAPAEEGVAAAAAAAPVETSADDGAEQGQTAEATEPSLDTGSTAGETAPAAAAAVAPDTAGIAAAASTAAAPEDAAAADAGTTDVVMHDAAAADAPAADAPAADAPAADASAAGATSPSDEPGAAAAATATSPTEPSAAAAAAATPTLTLSPVMQYLAAAHRLRKEICLPRTPAVKRTRPPAEDTAPAAAAAAAAAAENPSGSGSDSDSGSGSKPGSKSGKEQQSDKGENTDAEEEEEEEEEFHTPSDSPSEAAPAPEAQPEPQLDPVAEAAKAAAIDAAVTLIRRHRFGHEHVGDTGLLRVPDIWAAFLDVGMPVTALVRNLGRMTQLGLMARADCRQHVVERLTDPRVVSGARLHPMTLLDAMCTYRNGAGVSGVARWEPEPAVLEALEAAFYLAFKNVEPTGKRYLAGLDVSGSMSSPCSGMQAVSCREAAAAVLMSLARCEPWLKTLAFSDQLVPLEIKSEDKLQDVVSRTDELPFGGTDCALPILHALERRIPVDVFVILTDNETWYGSVHPAEALLRYRAAMDLPDAKLVVLAFNAGHFSIADPKDPGMLDVAGLDSAVPRLVADFVAGRLLA
ncbi:hypothetical protein Agub_g3300 [Astrephomene gubernaculifera]|uniref:TROVE domain-containing protein n=1 Tax=Astrephomene gubernaculifera TaxID=47775 RepID=A0AAD3HJ20_9CHLO|nr:hypothetical protein Agub_g3300 [Astrephomene gubernaculifera]